MLAEEAQPEVDAAAAIVAVELAVVDQDVVYMVEEESWRYVEGRWGTSGLVEDRLDMTAEEVLDRHLEQLGVRSEGVAVVVLAAEVCVPGVAEVVRYHISTHDCSLPALETAFQNHNDWVGGLHREGEEEEEGRHLFEETVGVVSEVEAVGVHWERE